MDTNEHCTRRNVWALKAAGAILSGLALVIIVARHVPDEANVGGARVAAGEAAPPAAPYYFPSQYELNAPPDDRGAAPSF